VTSIVKEHFRVDDAIDVHCETCLDHLGVP
jgi:hypothetical protein